MSRGERFEPPPNLAPEGLEGRALHVLRRLLDLQVASVVRDLAPVLAAAAGGKVLEVGCGDSPYRRLVPESCRYRGLDWAGSENFRYRPREGVLRFDGGNFPLRDRSFDLVFHTEVIEHVWDTGNFLEECLRVLKPGGRLFFTVPFAARYHYAPHDYWRFTPSAL